MIASWSESHGSLWPVLNLKDAFVALCCCVSYSVMNVYVYVKCNDI